MAEIYNPNTGSILDIKQAFDPSRCKAGVTAYHGRWPHYGQCQRKHSVEGWCKQHHPDAEKKRREAQEEAYLNDMRKRALGWHGPMLVRALEQIRDGDNNPRETARIALEGLE